MSDIKEKTYAKSAFLKLERYRDKRDLLNVLLSTEERYTEKQVDDLVKQFMSKSFN